MTERQLRELLQNAPLAEANQSEDRLWRVVRASRAGVAMSRRRAWHRSRAGLVAVCALGLGALVLATASPPREALARWIRQAFGAVTRRSVPTTLAGLPPGKLLVNSASGVWLVSSDGLHRRLGDDAGAELSPHGLFVLGWRGSTLQVVSPGGVPQWTMQAPAPVRLARWSADGYRIAYIAGESIRIVAGGDGSGDRDLVDAVANVAPAWRPATGGAHLIAVVDRGGYVQLRNADTGRLLWRRRPRLAPAALFWSPDGHVLAAVTPGGLTFYDANGRAVASLAAPAGDQFGAAAFGPSDDRLALVLSSGGSTDTVETMAATPAGLRRPPTQLLTVAEQMTELAWSPDGQWLLAASPSADEWTVIHARAPVSLRSISNVASKFQAARGAFPTLGGWAG